MQNKEIIINREQAQALSEALQECLSNEKAFHIKINVANDSIQLTAHVHPIQVKLWLS